MCSNPQEIPPRMMNPPDEDHLQPVQDVTGLLRAAYPNYLLKSQVCAIHIWLDYTRYNIVHIILNY